MMDDGLFVSHISRGKDADAGADGQSWLGIFAHTRHICASDASSGVTYHGLPRIYTHGLLTD